MICFVAEHRQQSRNARTAAVTEAGKYHRRSGQEWKRARKDFTIRLCRGGIRRRVRSLVLLFNVTRQTQLYFVTFLKSDSFTYGTILHKQRKGGVVF